MTGFESIYPALGSEGGGSLRLYHQFYKLYLSGCTLSIKSPYTSKRHNEGRVLATPTVNLHSYLYLLQFHDYTHSAGSAIYRRPTRIENLLIDPEKNTYLIDVSFDSG